MNEYLQIIVFTLMEVIGGFVMGMALMAYLWRQKIQTHMQDLANEINNEKCEEKKAVMLIQMFQIIDKNFPYINFPKLNRKENEKNGLQK